MNLALFDFDGTITTKDSLPVFFKYFLGHYRYYFGLFVFFPIFILFKLKIIEAARAKEILISLFLKDADEIKFKKKAYLFSKYILPSLVGKNVLKELRRHVEQGDRVFVVSASIHCWLKYWCEQENVELISTELLFKNSKYTGKFSTKNCNGKEKVMRITDTLVLVNYSTISVYGNSDGDREMFNLATSAFFVKDDSITLLA